MQVRCRGRPSKLYERNGGGRKTCGPQIKVLNKLITVAGNRYLRRSNFHFHSTEAIPGAGIVPTAVFHAAGFDP